MAAAIASRPLSLPNRPKQAAIPAIPAPAYAATLSSQRVESLSSQYQSTSATAASPTTNAVTAAHSTRNATKRPRRRR